MSSKIDQRAVEMQFNNKQFESGVKTSTQSLENLKKGLNLDESTKKLSGLSAVAKAFTLGNISDNVQTIANRFTTLGIVGVTAIQRIANAAITYGKQITTALTVTPITTGFAEYELKMGSIQVIMAGTGESLQTVNKYLNDLNTYSDKTIYSFADMTTNIGKFTNAGVGLKDAVAAIQGVANVAAVSGANAGEASRAMYNFAQALSAGYVKLLDWKSIELANMATMEFKQQLIDTAVATGTLTQTADGLYKTLEGTVMSATKNFNDSLQDQWMTTEVLTETLQKYSDETTEIGKKAFAAAQDIKTFSMLYDTLKEAAQSGWAQSWEILIGDFEEAKALLTDINNVIGDFIGQSAAARNELLQGWKDLGGRTVLIEALSNAFKAFVSVIQPIKDAFREIFPRMTAEQLFSLTERFRDFTATLKLSGPVAENIKRTFKGVFAIFDIGKQLFLAIAKGIQGFISTLLPAGEGLLDFTARIGDWLVSLDNAVRSSGVFNTAMEIVGTALGAVVGAIQTLISFIGSLTSAFLSLGDIGTDSVEGKMGIFATGAAHLRSILDRLAKALEKVSPKLVAFGKKIGNAIVDLVSKMSDALGEGGFSAILDVFNTGVFAGILLTFRKLIKPINTFDDILDDLGDTLQIWQTSIQAKTILRIAIAIGILAASVLVLSSIDPKKMTVALAGLTTLFIELMTAMGIFTVMTKDFIPGFKSMTTLSIGLMVLATSILVLSVAMKLLSTIDWNGIAKGLVSIGALLGMLVATSKFLSVSAGFARTAVGILVLSSSLLILGFAMKLFSTLAWGEIAKGLATVASLLGILIATSKLLSANSVGITRTATGLTILAVAIGILAISMKIFSTLNWVEMAKGLTTIAVILGLFIVTSRMLSTSGVGLAKAAVGMLIIAGAIGLLAISLKKFGNMSIKELAKGLITLALALTIMVTAMKFMKTGIVGAAAMVIMAVAMEIMAKVLKKFASLSIGDIVKSLIVLVAVFAIFGGMAALLGPLTPVMLALGGALLLFGVAALAAGMGVSLFAAGLTALVAIGSAGIAVLTGMIIGIAKTIPEVMKQVALGIVAMAQVVIDNAPVIIEAIMTVLLGMMDAIIEALPKIAELINALVVTILDVLVENIPKMVDAGMKMLLGILQGIADNLGDVITAGVDVVVAFIKGIADNIGRVIDEGFKLVIAFINGLADAIRNNSKTFAGAVKNLITAGIRAAADLWSMFKDLGKSLINGLIEGIKSMGSAVWNAVKGAASSAWNGIKSFFGCDSPSKVFMQLGTWLGEGLIIGVDSMGKKVTAATADMGAGALDATKKVIAGIADTLSSDVELSPTIKPVVDMTDVQNGINSTFDNVRQIDVSATTKKASTVSTATKSATNGETSITKPGDSVQNVNNINIENHYSVRSDNDIRKISQDLKTTLDRYSFAKGVLASS